MIPRSPCKYFFSSRSQSLCGKQGDKHPGVSWAELMPVFSLLNPAHSTSPLDWRSSHSPIPLVSDGGHLLLVSKNLSRLPFLSLHLIFIYSFSCLSFSFLFFHLFLLSATSSSCDHTGPDRPQMGTNRPLTPPLKPSWCFHSLLPQKASDSPTHVTTCPWCYPAYLHSSGSP